MAKGEKKRVFTWVILVVNILFLLWIVSGLTSASNNCSGMIGSDLDTCQGATAVGAGIGVIVIVFFWALVDVILGVLWLVTRPKAGQPAIQPQALLQPPAAPPGCAFTHVGFRFMLGHGPDFYGIWDASAPGPPVSRFPKTPEAWQEAWRTFNSWEPQARSIAAAPPPPA